MSTPSAQAGRAPRRATRDLREPIIGGVASGLARHLALPVLWIRVGFVVTAALGGMGIAFYAALWLLLPAGDQFETAAPGLESATRGGRRPGPDPAADRRRPDRRARGARASAWSSCWRRCSAGAR